MYQTQDNSNKVKILTVDSLFRDKNSSKSHKKTNNFQITYDEPINNVSKLELVEYSGPTSIRIISDQIKNNVFKLTINDGVSVVHYVKTPDIFRIERNIMNNDSINNFVQNINTQLQLISNQYNDITSIKLLFLHEIDNEVSNNELVNDRSVYFEIISNNATNIISIEVDFTKDENDNDIILERSLGYILGFREKSITINNILTNHQAYRIKSDSSIDLNNNFKYAYLVLDDNTTNSDSTIVTQNMKSKGVCSGSFKNGGNIIGKIIYRNELNYNFFNRVISTPREYFGNVDLVKFSVALVNEYGDYIDTQNLDWSFTLKLTTQY